MEAFLISTGIVALAEMGDKTQLLAFILAARFKKPLPIIMGIFLATVVNHGLAGVVGAWVANSIDPNILRWVLGISFLAMAITDHNAVEGALELKKRFKDNIIVGEEVDTGEGELIGYWYSGWETI